MRVCSCVCMRECACACACACVCVCSCVCVCFFHSFIHSFIHSCFLSFFLSFSPCLCPPLLFCLPAFDILTHLLRHNAPFSQVTVDELDQFADVSNCVQGKQVALLPICPSLHLALNSARFLSPWKRSSHMRALFCEPTPLLWPSFTHSSACRNTLCC